HQKREHVLKQETILRQLEALLTFQRVSLTSLDNVSDNDVSLRALRIKNIVSRGLKNKSDKVVSCTDNKDARKVSSELFEQDNMGWISLLFI
ncbi:hypothetical protein V2J09_016784, partial [Rumex salicifolius]